MSDRSDIGEELSLRTFFLWRGVTSEARRNLVRCGNDLGKSLKGNDVLVQVHRNIVLSVPGKTRSRTGQRPKIRSVRGGVEDPRSWRLRVWGKRPPKRLELRHVQFTHRRSRLQAIVWSVKFYYL